MYPCYRVYGHFMTIKKCLETTNDAVNKMAFTAMNRLVEFRIESDKSYPTFDRKGNVNEQIEKLKALAFEEDES